MSKRKMVDVSCRDESFYYLLDGQRPAQIIEKMKALQEEFSGKDVYFLVKSYGYDGGLELELREVRPESDKEFKRRVAKEAKVRQQKKAQDEAKQARELAEYERLKKKYGR